MSLRTRFELPHALVLYKQLLRQATFLPDAALRYHVLALTKVKFRQRRLTRRVEDAEQGAYEAFTHLKRVVRANLGAPEELAWLAGHAYGFIGPVVAVKQAAAERRRVHGMGAHAHGHGGAVAPAPAPAGFAMPRWGQVPDMRVHPTHPRVLLTVTPLTVPAAAELERFLAALPAPVRAAYATWPVLATLAPAPASTHARTHAHAPAPTPAASASGSGSASSSASSSVSSTSAAASGTVAVAAAAFPASGSGADADADADAGADTNADPHAGADQ